MPEVPRLSLRSDKILWIERLTRKYVSAYFSRDLEQDHSPTFGLTFFVAIRALLTASPSKPQSGFKILHLLPQYRDFACLQNISLSLV
jgi:hypothetical protein